MKNSITALLKEIIKTLTQNNISSRSSSTTLKNDLVTRSVDSINNNFFIVPIGKANGNILIICKRFHMQVLIKDVVLENQINAKVLTITYKI